MEYFLCWQLQERIYNFPGTIAFSRLSPFILYDTTTMELWQIWYWDSIVVVRVCCPKACSKFQLRAPPSAEVNEEFTDWKHGEFLEEQSLSEPDYQEWGKSDSSMYRHYYRSTDFRNSQGTMTSANEWKTITRNQSCMVRHHKNGWKTSKVVLRKPSEFQEKKEKQQITLMESIDRNNWNKDNRIMSNKN